MVAAEREELPRRRSDGAQTHAAILEAAMRLASIEGLGQIEALCEAYLSYIERGVFPGGCFFAHLLAEYDAQSGPLHDQLVDGQRGWLGLLERLVHTAQERGELDPGADPTQVAFELSAAVELANYWSVLYRDTSFVARGRDAVRTALANAQSPSSVQ